MASTLGLAAADCVTPGAPGSRRYRWLALGDSNTSNRYAHVGVLSYPELFRSQNPDFEVVNAGVGSLTTQGMVDRWDELTALAAGLPVDVVTVMLGTNDHHQPAPGFDTVRVTLANFETNMRDIVARARPFVGRPAIALLAAPFVNTTDANAELSATRLETYNARTRALATEFGVPLVDMYKVTGDHCGYDDAVWLPLTADGQDGVHPVTSVHQLMCDALRPFLFALARGRER